MKLPKLLRVAPKPMTFDVAEPIPAEEVFYYRVSKGRDQDPDFQIALAKKRGIPDDNIFGDVESGKGFSRKGLKKALQLMEDRPGWTLVIWKLDRLGRNAHGLLGLMQEFQAKGWNLLSMTETIDTRTPMGRAFFGMLAVFAQLESDTTAERTRAGMARQKELGVNLGRGTQTSPEEFAEIERLLLKERAWTIVRIAKRFKVSTSMINHHFPGWRGKTRDARRAWRAKHPLPTKRDGK